MMHEWQQNSYVAVIGLHTVFEHRPAMTRVSIETFLHEFKVTLPVGIDMPNDNGPIPRSMDTWSQRGTPTLWLLDQERRLCAEHMGHVSDMVIGAQVGMLWA
ncbi:hypothetical protein [Roseovarius tolerans]|uniref:hypothetical protein n=1 Tax=Roseovarius tolerans TaxID=74031 RepID=UPI000942A83D|nr:hypothetical protein [Roseovarius tolerans]